MTEQYVRKVPTWVVCRAGSHLCVLLVIAAHAKNDGRAGWPSMRTVARLAGLKSPSTVAWHVAQLLELELLVVTEPGGPRRSTRYCVPWLSTGEQLRAMGSNISPELRAMGSNAARDGIERSARPDRAELDHELDKELGATLAPTPNGRAIIAGIRAELVARGAPEPPVSRRSQVGGLTRDRGLPLMDGRPVVDIVSEAV